MLVSVVVCPNAMERYDAFTEAVKSVPAQTCDVVPGVDGEVRRDRQPESPDSFPAEYVCGRIRELTGRGVANPFCSAVTGHGIETATTEIASTTRTSSIHP